MRCCGHLGEDVESVWVVFCECLLARVPDQVDLVDLDGGGDLLFPMGNSKDQHISQKELQRAGQFHKDDTYTIAGQLADITTVYLLSKAMK